MIITRFAKTRMVSVYTSFPDRLYTEHFNQVVVKLKVKSIFVPVKKVLAVITFLISMVITIAHDAIHHHHDTPENIEFISGSHSDDHGHNDNDDHHNHFPPHQHVISEGNLLAGRNTIPHIKVIKDSNQDWASLSTPYSDFDFYTYFTGFVRIIKKPLSSFPLIISINSTRGSPTIS